MVSSFIILTNCKTTSEMIDWHFKHLTVGDIRESIKTEFSIDVDVTGNADIPFIKTKSEDHRLEFKYPFYTRYAKLV